LNVGPDEVAMLGTTLSIGLTSAAGERSTRTAAIVRNFAEIGGGIGLVIDSFGMLALCVDRGSAAEELSVAPGDAVVLTAVAESGGVTTRVTLRPPSRGD
jgi:S-adenosylmethionine hydrolase